MVSKLSDILPNPANPRTITESRFDSLSGSLDEFGDLSGVVYNSNPECPALVSGHQRMKVFKGAKAKFANVERYDTPDADGTVARGFIQLKDGTLFVYREVQWTKEKADRATIVANGQFGQWDSDVLSNQWDFDVPELLDMGVPEFVLGLDSEGGIPNNALNSEKLEAKEDDYEIPEEIKTDIVTGDLFEIGPHRLLCGDSTSREDVNKLLNGNKPFLMVTDPPYGVEYDPEWRADAGINKNKDKMGKVKNDDRADWTESYSLSPGCVAYIWHDGRHAKTVQQNIEDCGFVVRNQIIWAKDRFALSRGNYHWQHEPCWYAVRKGKSAAFIGERNNSTLWTINSRDDGGHGHGTQKPVECMARPIRNHEGDVYDPFLGSGTTMVAAHQLNRRCYGMEIDPKYCQVIVDRMLKLDPTLEIKRNGQVFTNFK